MSEEKLDWVEMNPHLPPKADWNIYQTTDGTAMLQAPDGESISVDRLKRIHELTTGKTCWWVQDLDCGDIYDTECGNRHEFIDGGPKENFYKYCPYCGKEIKG